MIRQAAPIPVGMDHELYPCLPKHYQHTCGRCGASVPAWRESAGRVTYTWPEFVEKHIRICDPRVFEIIQAAERRTEPHTEINTTEAMGASQPRPEWSTGTLFEMRTRGARREFYDAAGRVIEQAKGSEKDAWEDDANDDPE